MKLSGRVLNSYGLSYIYTAAYNLYNVYTYPELYTIKWFNYHILNVDEYVYDMWMGIG